MDADETRIFKGKKFSAATLLFKIICENPRQSAALKFRWLDTKRRDANFRWMNKNRCRRSIAIFFAVVFAATHFFANARAEDSQQQPAASPVSSNDAASLQVAALLQKGDAEVSKGELRAALADFDQADKIEPNDAGILLRISQQCSDLIEQTKNQTEAQNFAQRSLDAAQRAVKLAPENAKAHLALAIAYGRMTDFTSNKTKLEYSRIIKAEAERAIALDPREDFAYHVLGRWHYGVATLNPMLKMMARMVYGGMPDASLDEAARNLKKAAEITPQRIMHHFELARVYVALGKRDLAKKEWQTILALKPEDSEDEQDQRAARVELAKK